MKYINILLITIILTASSQAHDYVPGTPQVQPILLKNGTLHTVSSGTLIETDLLFENGIITQIGKNLQVPDNCKTIDVTGKDVYPGLISPYTYIGLIEIGNADATKDYSELGDNNAEVQSYTAYNPDSEHLPTIRANGITTALVAPVSSLVNGRSSLLNMDGWTVEDAMVKKNVGLHINWPSMRVNSRVLEDKSAEKQRKENRDKLDRLYQIFDKAYAYYLSKKAGRYVDLDVRDDAILPAFEGDLLIFIHADDYVQIDNAIEFCQKYGFKMILVGGNDAPLISDKLKKYAIPVILSKTQENPPGEDFGYDYRYSLPAKLAEDSIHFCLAASSYRIARNLPFQASQAVAFGLSKELALRSITLSTAEILGVADKLGSLDVGKSATIVVSEGDILDHMTHNVVLEFIEGKEVDLNSKHKELYEKYRQKQLY